MALWCIEFFNTIYSCWEDSWGVPGGSWAFLAFPGGFLGDSLEISAGIPGGFLEDSRGIPGGFLVIWVQEFDGALMGASWNYWWSSLHCTFNITFILFFQVNEKLNIPKKTKLFVEQSSRERENGTLMHRVFQHDLFLLRLNTARAFVRALQTSSNPITTGWLII